MHFIRYSNKEFDFERLLIPAVLKYTDLHALIVIEYRTLDALMVQPEPEGVGSRDSEPAVQGQGGPRENVNERSSGVGGESVDQQAETSSFQNVAKHIGQISSKVQMETLFEAAEQDLEEVEQSVPERLLHLRLLSF